MTVIMMNGCWERHRSARHLGSREWHWSLMMTCSIFLVGRGVRMPLGPYYEAFLKHLIIRSGPFHFRCNYRQPLSHSSDRSLFVYSFLFSSNLCCFLTLPCATKTHLSCLLRAQWGPCYPQAFHVTRVLFIMHRLTQKARQSTEEEDW